MKKKASFKPNNHVILNWFRDNGDETLRLRYPLSENSVVFDVGGYLGKWSNKIVERYNPRVYIFEPVPEYFSKIKFRFKDNPKVSAFNFGLSNRTSNEIISIDKDSSSVHKKTNKQATIKIEDITAFISKNKIKRINLIKINIEGGEYDLLKGMIDSGSIKKCDDIQIQFHNFYPCAKKLREEIRKALAKTHFLTYDYPFVWENWRRFKKSGLAPKK